MNNKVRGDKYVICLQFLTPAEYRSAFKILIYQGSVATYLRWGGYCHMGFV